jgi:hypothetical protein
VKINAIAAALKKDYNLIVYTDGKTQYLSNGFAVYLASNLPPITSAEQLCAILGITDEQEGKYNIKIGEPLPPVLRRNAIYHDRPMDKSELSVKWHGMQYTAFTDSTNAIFVKSQYLTPFKDIDEAIYYDRTDGKKEHFITVEAGMIGLIGVICPTNFSKNDPMSKELSKIVEMIGLETENDMLDMDE